MVALSNWLETELRKHCLRSGSFTKPTTIAVALCTSATSDSQTGATISEVANSNGYARQVVGPSDAAWTAVSDGTASNADPITFTAAGGSWGEITHVAICDSATWHGGNLLFHGALNDPITIEDQDSLVFDIGTLSIEFS